jgi:hypothetical protein
MAYEIVNHDNFNKIYDMVKHGTMTFYVPRAYGKTTIIDSKTINKFEDKGLKVLWIPKNEGNGFRLSSGKHSVYLCYTHLIAQ